MLTLISSPVLHNGETEYDVVISKANVRKHFGNVKVAPYKAPASAVPGVAENDEDTEKNTKKPNTNEPPGPPVDQNIVAFLETHLDLSTESHTAVELAAKAAEVIC